MIIPTYAEALETLKQKQECKHLKLGFFLIWPSGVHLVAIPEDYQYTPPTRCEFCLDCGKRVI